ncbi:class I adenylate-forming enzyme family protein [Rhodoligotrophos defluvii]|uniref:class I adenylate-forming enzyme family protein n=1 Tax=Rhodoligotrophos defluvii TaxID=2561934 RepID=UPI0010C9756C|nr:AMP-binding protein [Rhodoligotrophos defluvii]
MSVDAHLRNAFRRYAGRTALVDGDRRWTFAELEHMVARLSTGLGSVLERGSRVGLFMANRAEYLILKLALEQAGLVRVPLNARYTAYEVQRILDDCGARAVFADAATIERLKGITGLWVVDVDGGSEGGPAWRTLLATEAGAPNPPDDYDALCSINYTSGSSGVPKGVMLSHRNWLSVYKNMLVDRDIRSSDRLAHIGPLTHASGTYAIPFLLRGATNVLVPGGALGELLPTLERERVTAFSCVPTVLTRILNAGNIDSYDLSSIRWVGYGAEAIQRNTLAKALTRWGDVLTHNYGLTEAMMTCSFLTAAEHLAPDGTLRHGCIGRPYSFVDIVLRDERGKEVPTGEIGEITIQAEHVMRGYWNRPEETAKVLRDGWLWSGDLARRDSDGLIHIVGRSKEMLISGGFNIYPAEVEACLSSCPGVQEVAVIGLPDDQFGEICVAFVAPEDGAALTREQCEAHARPKLGIRAPRRWHFVPHLPRTANGKIDKAALRTQLEGGGTA